MATDGSVWQSRKDCCRLVRQSCRRWMDDVPFDGRSNGIDSVAVGVDKPESSDGNSLDSIERNSSPDSRKHRRYVGINEQAIADCCPEIVAKHRHKPTEWDEEGWHYTGNGYTGTSQLRQERVALYILALDAINFCFWPSRKGPQHTNSLEYDALALALKSMAEHDDRAHPESAATADAHAKSTQNRSSSQSSSQSSASTSTDASHSLRSYVFSPQSLARMTVQEMVERLVQQHLPGFFLDNIQKRCALWNELGSVIQHRFDGSAMNMIRQARGNAPALVDIIVDSFPGFRDVAHMTDIDVWFLKRAQIVVGDLNAALNLQLDGMNELTCFADYRVPQILRQLGILEYSTALSAQIDAQREIERDTDAEVSIRAATVVAVDSIVHRLNKIQSQHKFTAVEVDWHLWQVGERLNRQGDLPHFHRVRTHFY